MKINIKNFVDYQILVYVSSAPSFSSALTQVSQGRHPCQQSQEDLLLFGYSGTKASDP